MAELRQTIYYRYEKLLKVENIIGLFKTHLDNKTVPKSLCFNRFPKPLWADDPIFVDDHNNIIRYAQEQIVKSIIERGNVIVNCLNTELMELRSTLDLNYNGNKDRFFDNIKSTVQINLKSYFDTSNAKLLKLQSNHFEDLVSVEYEVQDNVSDEYVKNYLEISGESDTKKPNTNISKNIIMKKHNNFHQRNNFNNNKKNTENASSDDNWRSNMIQNQTHNNSNDSAYQRHNNHNNSLAKRVNRYNNSHRYNSNYQVENNVQNNQAFSTASNTNNNKNFQRVQDSITKR